MKEVMDWIINNPETVGIILLLLESVLMPFIPIKWNGLAVLLLRMAKTKLAKPSVTVATPAPTDPNKSRQDQIVSDMQKAVDEMNKKSASDRLAQ